MEKLTTVAFVGYRPDKIFQSAPNNSNIMWDIIAKLDKIVQKLYADGKRTFLTGMTEGFEILAGEAIIRAREKHKDVQLIAVVPFNDQSKDFSFINKTRHLTLLINADQVIEMSPDDQPDAYDKRNQFLVDNSDTIITYFDGQPGNTASALALAQSHTIINLVDGGVI